MAKQSHPKKSSRWFRYVPVNLEALEQSLLRSNNVLCLTVPEAKALVHNAFTLLDQLGKYGKISIDVDDPDFVAWIGAGGAGAIDDHLLDEYMRDRRGVGAPVTADLIERYGGMLAELARAFDVAISSGPMAECYRGLQKRRPTESERRRLLDSVGTRLFNPLTAKLGLFEHQSYAHNYNLDRTTIADFLYLPPVEAWRAKTGNGGGAMEKRGAVADPPETVPMRENEQAFFDRLTLKAQPGKQLAVRLARDGFPGIGEPEISKMWKLSHMLARGVRLRKGAGYYRVQVDSKITPS